VSRIPRQEHAFGSTMCVLQGAQHSPPFTGAALWPQPMMTPLQRTHLRCPAAVSHVGVVMWLRSPIASCGGACLERAANLLHCRHARSEPCGLVPPVQGLSFSVFKVGPHSRKPSRASSQRSIFNLNLCDTRRLDRAHRSCRIGSCDYHSSVSYLQQPFSLP
jgi:hypothetical protein